MAIEIVKLKQKLDGIFAKGVTHLEIEDQEHYSRYLCVIVSGFLELSVRDVFVRYVRDHAHPVVTQFCARYMEGVYNCKLNKIIELAKLFDTDWEARLKLVVTEEMKAALDSVVANKNAIAHGQPDNISFVRIRDYCGEIKAFIRELNAFLHPTT